eukprot:TRINITY_DN6519_c0_g3_i1.p1 TRINITY_DN6519_c0_g3~~TRINITY_DN6519_c0_g3_i1.p1  ORF type:complete len:599 (+),score=141.49 TRINITY_DN6519_c0_g3_i1:57-1853(+)
MAADAVHKIMEEAVPALEYYYARNVFSRDELKEIVKKRTATEYMLHGPGCCYNEVLKALNYERTLEQLRNRRSPKTPLRNRHDEHITDRIMNLYDRFADTLEGEERIRIAYHKLDFLDSSKVKDHDKKAGQVLGKLVNEFPSRQDVWIYAARYEMEKHHSIDNSRGLLQRSLRLVPEGIKVWRAYFMIELTYLGELLEKLKENPPQDELAPSLKGILAGGIPKVVFLHAMKSQAKSEDSLSLALDFLKIARKFQFTKNIQKAIVSYLETHHAEDDKTKATAVSAGFFEAEYGCETPAQWSGVEQLAGEDTETECPQLAEVYEKLLDDGCIGGVMLVAAEAMRVAYDVSEEIGLREVVQGSMEGATHPHFLATVDAFEAVANGRLPVTCEQHCLDITHVLEAASRTAALPPFLAATAKNTPSPSVILHLLSFRYNTSLEYLTSSIAATRACSDAYVLWTQHVLATYGTPSLQATVVRHLRDASSMQTGTARDTALVKFGGTCILADPANAIECLSTVHKLPEALATQLLTAAISQCGGGDAVQALKRRKIGGRGQSGNADETKVRQLFDKMLRGPAGLGKSAMLWARWCVTIGGTDECW